MPDEAIWPMGVFCEIEVKDDRRCFPRRQGARLEAPRCAHGRVKAGNHFRTWAPSPKYGRELPLGGGKRPPVDRSFGAHARLLETKRREIPPPGMPKTKERARLNLTGYTHKLTHRKAHPPTTMGRDIDQNFTKKRIKPALILPEVDVADN